MTSNTLRVLTALSLALGAFVMPSAYAAAAAAVHCGDTISGNITLSEDLHCDGSTGLTLTPGATIDLGGHTLYADTNTRGPGILVPDAGNVLVTNGTLRGWDTAIENADDGTPNPGNVLLSKLTLFRDVFGVALLGASRNGARGVAMQVTDSTFIRNNSAAFVTGGRFILIHSYVKDANRGVDATNADVTVRNSIFQSDDTQVECFDSSCSISDNTVRDGDVGVLVYQNPGTGKAPVVISGNRFARLSLGVSTLRASGPVTITRNRFAQAGVAVNAKDSFVSMTHNDVRDGTTGFAYARTASGGGNGAIVAFNTFTGNHDGVYVDLPAAQAAAVRIGSNAANGNADYGIYAPGATDRGGNTASGNGHDPQCVGVVCS